MYVPLYTRTWPPRDANFRSRNDWITSSRFNTIFDEAVLPSYIIVGINSSYFFGSIAPYELLFLYARQPWTSGSCPFRATSFWLSMSASPLPSTSLKMRSVGFNYSAEEIKYILHRYIRRRSEAPKLQVARTHPIKPAD